MTNFSDLSTWMTELSVTRMLCSCITLGFCNSTYTGGMSEGNEGKDYEYCRVIK
jgi:hypothetical protein